MIQLVFIEESPSPGRHHAVQPGTTIGRADCDILLPDPDVSRHHAVVREAGASLAIEDLGSTNGTFVNGRRISEVTELGEGATLRFGNTVWRLQTPADATHIAAPAAGTRASDSPPAPKVDDGAPQTAEPASPVAAAPPADLPPAPVEAPAGPPSKDGRRGDVPAPERVPSAIVPVLPPAGEPAPFSAPAPVRVRGSAARRLEATLICFGVVLATAVAVTVFFIAR